MRGALALGVIAAVAVAVLWIRGNESSSPSEVGRKSETGARSGDEDGRRRAGLAEGTEIGTTAPAPPIRMRSDGEGEGDDEGEDEGEDDDDGAAGPRTAGADAFATETYDPPWAEEKESRVQEVLGGLQERLGASLHGAEVRSVDCKSTQCAIAVGGADSAAVVRLVEAIGDEPGFHGDADGIQMTRSGDDMVLYLRFRR